MSTPIARLRASHAMRANGDGDPFCGDCEESWPCDVIAALDALEEDVVKARSEAWKELGGENRRLAALVEELQAENARLIPVVMEANTWHEMDCNCLCDCGECNKPSGPCALGAALASLAGDKEASNE